MYRILKKRALNGSVTEMEIEAPEVAPALAPVCRADAAGPVPSDTALPDSSGTPESSAAPEDAQSAISNPYGPYAMIWVSLIIGLICILIAAAVFFFSGRN